MDGSSYNSATNVGYSPTFKDNVLSVETHIIDFNGDIYGKNIQVLFIERLRDEMTFAGPEELAAQIRKDVQRATELLSRKHINLQEHE
jgi:riboflavin kinase/FMN adenylyltransferase